jgi:hypothetical protein
MRRARRGRDQAGIGVVLVIAVGTLVLGMGLLAHRIFDGAMSSSSSHVTYEQALHLAEHGIDQTLARIQQDPTYSNGPDLPDSVVSGPPEKAWVVRQIETAAVQTAPEGEFVALKPRNRNVVYAASWVPSRAHARRTRIVKAEYLLSAYNPDDAILTGGDLTLNGTVDVAGIAGNVHSNGALTVIGTPSISGSLTSSGRYSESGGPTVLGPEKGGGYPEHSLPTIDPLQEWLRHVGPAADPDTAYDAVWYDLCPDGTVRRPDGTAPCRGSLADGFAPGMDYQGWTLRGDTWEFAGNNAFDGVFFAHEGNIKVSGSPGSAGTPWTVTLMASGSGPEGDVATGDITISGSAVMAPMITDLALLARRDLDLTGTPGQGLNGLVAAHEQVRAAGHVSIVGSIVAEDAGDSPGSPVHANGVAGTVSLVYDGGIEVPIGSVIRTTLWLEL